jgi:prepilin-type N-terminal cleavage/methylation domain-containing protein
MSRVRRLVRGHAGYTLIELLLAMLLLATVVVALSAAFVSGTRSELTLNQRFQAQMNAAVALSKLRQDVHCSSSISPATSSSVTLVQPTQCVGGGGSVTWCTVGSGTKYSLYRQAGSTCDATGKLYAQYLTTASVFTYTAQSTSGLAKLHVDFPVNVSTSQTQNAYELTDDIVLKNSTRS